jgi:hypothetical protein
MRFLQSAVDLFPELAPSARIRGAGGKILIESETLKTVGIDTASHAVAEAIVFLDRSAGPARLNRVKPSEALERILEDDPAMDDRVEEANHAVLRRLLEIESFELRYSGVDDAVDLLETVLR